MQASIEFSHKCMGKQLNDLALSVSAQHAMSKHVQAIQRPAHREGIPSEPGLGCQPGPA